MARNGLRKSSKNNRLLVGLIAATAVAIFVIVLLGVQSLFQQETYYVLKEKVNSRTQVTPEMLEPVTTSEGSAPKNALGLEQIQGGRIFTKYPLDAGDILSPSTVGALEDISVGIPDAWVVTSFSVSADDAVGGRIVRGTYFDMMIATSDGSFYPFVNLLALDTTVSLNNASSAQAVDTKEAHSGQTTQYFVGLSPKDAARLQNVVKKYGPGIKLVLSPRANEYQKPALSDYNEMFRYDQATDGTIWAGDKDGREITDYTFTPPKRDEIGRPIPKRENCSKGNSKVTDKACSKAAKTQADAAAKMSGASDKQSDSTDKQDNTSEASKESEPTTSATGEPTESTSASPSTSESSTTAK